MTCTPEYLTAKDRLDGVCSELFLCDVKDGMSVSYVVFSRFGYGVITDNDAVGFVAHSGQQSAPLSGNAKKSCFFLCNDCACC